MYIYYTDISQGGWPVHVCLATEFTYATIAKFTVTLVSSTTVQVGCSVCPCLWIFNHRSTIRHIVENGKHPGSLLTSRPIPVTSVGQISGEKEVPGTLDASPAIASVISVPTF